MSIAQASREAAAALLGLDFAPPVACVYDPLDYAWDVHLQYLQKYGTGTREVLLVGMNPGPFGMVQTGIPFGEVEAVRSWLGLRGEVRRPRREHPKRPVLGFACERSEVSGRRLWGWAARRFVIPQRFFRRFFVHNYCPLAFVDDDGANLTPDKLPREQTEAMFKICDRLLVHTVTALKPSRVVGIGAFAESRLQRALGHLGVRIARVPHPSPASPLANQGWEQQMDQALHDAGVDVGAES